MKVNKKILEIVDIVDKDFISDMKKNKTLHLLSHIDEIYSSYLASQFNMKLIVGWYLNSKDFDVILKYYVMFKDKKVPYCTILASTILDSTRLVFGGVHISSDGEYRSNMMNISDMPIITKIISMILDNESCLTYLNKLREGVIIKTKAKAGTKRIEKAYEKIKLPDIILAYCIWSNKNGVRAANMLPEYILMMDELNDYMEGYSFNERAMFKLYRRACYSVKMSLKVMPATDSDIDNVGLVTRRCWHEIYITKLLSSLIANSICYNFPNIYGWIFIDGYDYDNPVLKAKINHSRDAEKIKEKLGELLTQTIDGYDNLPNYIDVSIKYLDNNLVFSTKSVAFILQNVGDAMSSIFNDSEWSRSIRQPHIFNGILFQMAYALMCMNRVGIIHNDLHLNNVVIYKGKLRSEHKNKTSFSLYHVDDEYRTVRHDGYMPYIIDFSRAIMNMDLIEQTGSYGIINELIRVTESGIKTGYKYYLPEFYNNHKEHIAYCITRMGAKMFQLYTAIDMYRISTTLSDAFINIGVNMESLNEIKYLCKEYLTDKVLDIDNIAEIVNPNRVIMDKLKTDGDNNGILMYYNNFHNKSGNLVKENIQEYCEPKPNIYFGNIQNIIKRMCLPNSYAAPKIVGDFPKNMPNI